MLCGPVIQPAQFPAVPLPDHALFDSGDGEKLERFGPVVLRRPDPQALWRPRLAPSEWARADLAFVRESDRGGRWEARRDAHAAARGANPAWEVAAFDARFVVQPTPFKHVGLFPEQAGNWRHLIERAGSFGVERPELLDLFGYTGAASVLAARAGYSVTHVDASKTSVTWARENAERSGLAGDAVRWVVDDALSFARREVRRGRRYHALVLDPPSFGRGPKGETWRFEEGITPLIEAAAQLVGERALIVLSTYAIGCSPLTLHNLLAGIGGGSVEAGELVLREEEGGRALPAGFCARWSRGLAP